MLKRERYLAKIRPYYFTDEIKILVGIRRCGKSTILSQIRQELSSSEANIVFYDFEDFEDALFINHPLDFYQKIKKQYQAGKKNILLIDEVQYLEDYERLLASARSSLGYSIIVTGSTSRLLSNHLGTRLTGRSIEFHILPFTFQEYVEYSGMTGKEAFDHYLVYGGMPSAIQKDKSEILPYLYRLYKGILTRDICANHEIRNNAVFERIASFVMARSGEIVSATSITDYLKTEGGNAVSLPTVDSYINYLEESFLITQCERYSIKGKQRLTSQCKSYAVDPGFVSIQEHTGNLNLGFLCETVVYNELHSRGYEVYAGKTFKGEIDFVVKHNSDICYLQVTYLLNGEQAVLEREFGAFTSIKDNWQKIVLSLDDIDYSRDGIKHWNLIDFLLGKELFEK